MLDIINVFESWNIVALFLMSFVEFSPHSLVTLFADHPDPIETWF